MHGCERAVIGTPNRRANRVTQSATDDPVIDWTTVAFSRGELSVTILGDFGWEWSELFERRAGQAARLPAEVTFRSISVARHRVIVRDIVGNAVLLRRALNEAARYATAELSRLNEAEALELAHRLLEQDHQRRDDEEITRRLRDGAGM